MFSTIVEGIHNRRGKNESLHMEGLIFIMLALVIIGALILGALWREWEEAEEAYYKLTTSNIDIDNGIRENEEVRVPEVENEDMKEKSIESIPNKVIIEVPYIDQTNGYPTGCEIVSATMILQYYGFDITVDEFIDNYLEMDFLEEYDGGIWGENPNEAFIGDPRSIYSYGCYASVIEDSLSMIIKEDMEVKNTTGAGMDELGRDYINNKIPVLIWTTINLVESYPSTQWQLKGSGELYQWKANEHCMVLVGYDETSYYFNDPYDNNGVIAYDKELVELRYNEMGEQSVVLIPG